MTGPLHSEAAAGRWWQLSLCEQLGNVSSEVSRALRWKSRNRRIATGAIHRALELMDLTLADPRYRSSVTRLRELARTREVLVDFLLGSNEYRSTDESLNRYFDAYALAATLARERSAQG